jgi:hypothetical protein
MTGKTEKNLEQASFVIDLLAVLQEKTKGNLTDTEARLLDNVLRDLRLNYVSDNTVPAASTPDSSGELS